jgi:hypothetical protein
VAARLGAAIRAALAGPHLLVDLAGNSPSGPGVQARAGRLSEVAPMRCAPIVLTAFLLMLAGCGAGGTAPAPAVRYLAPPAVNCPATAGARPGRAEPLAAGFVPVSASRCTFTLVIDQPSDKVRASPPVRRGGWEWQTVQRSRGPFDTLVKSLRTATPAGPGKVCPDVLHAPTVLTLTDAAGHIVVPAIPATSCDVPDPAVQQAIDRMTWTTDTRR